MNIRNISILVVGVLITQFCVFLYFKQSWNEGTSVLDHFGSFFGGVFSVIFSIISVYFVIKTLTEQNNQFYKQQVESRFFELLRLHRDNVNEMQLKQMEWQGRKVLAFIRLEIKEALAIVRNINNQNRVVLDADQILNITYQGVFFGFTGVNSEAIIKERLSKYGVDFIDQIIAEFRIKINDPEIQKRLNYKRIFDGHQSRIGHYFRHLYQIVSYIDNLPSDKFTFEEKYNYIKTLRAQLSNHEQSLFFFNSLSDLGRVWELSLNDENKKLITKYNLIKNIPNEFTLGIDMKNYYPNVTYEGEVESQLKKNLKKRYT